MSSFIFFLPDGSVVDVPKERVNAIPHGSWMYAPSVEFWYRFDRQLMQGGFVDEWVHHEEHEVPAEFRTYILLIQ